MNLIERIERKEFAAIMLDISDFKNEGKVTAHDVYTHKLLRLAEIGEKLVSMHQDCSDCSDCSTAGICAEVIESFDKNDSCCQNCDCYAVCEALVAYYARYGAGQEYEHKQKQEPKPDVPPGKDCSACECTRCVNPNCAPEGDCQDVDKCERPMSNCDDFEPRGGL